MVRITGFSGLQLEENDNRVPKGKPNTKAAENRHTTNSIHILENNFQGIKTGIQCLPFDYKQKRKHHSKGLSQVNA